MTGKASMERMKPKKLQHMAYKMCKSRTRREEVIEHQRLMERIRQTHHMEHMQDMEHMQSMGQDMEHMQSMGQGMEFRRTTTRRPSNSTGR